MKCIVSFLQKYATSASFSPTHPASQVNTAIHTIIWDNQHIKTSSHLSVLRTEPKTVVIIKIIKTYPVQDTNFQLVIFRHNTTSRFEVTNLVANCFLFGSQKLTNLVISCFLLCSQKWTNLQSWLIQRNGQTWQSTALADSQKWTNLSVNCLGLIHTNEQTWQSTCWFDSQKLTSFTVNCKIKSDLHPAKWTVWLMGQDPKTTVNQLSHRLVHGGNNSHGCESSHLTDKTNVNLQWIWVWIVERGQVLGQSVNHDLLHGLTQLCGGWNKFTLLASYL